MTYPGVCELVAVVVRMIGRSLLFIVITAIVSHDCAVIPDSPSSVGFHAARQNRNPVQFGEGIRDWFKSMRDSMRERLFGKESSHLPSPMDLSALSAVRQSMMTNNEMMQKMIVRPGDFFVDLSNLKFNPAADWGVHIGNWYIIYKSDMDDGVYRYNTEDSSEWKDFFDIPVDNSEARNWNDAARGSEATLKENDADELEVFDDLSVEILKPMADDA